MTSSQCSDLAELDAPDGVAERVQWRRPECHRHDVGHHQQHTPAHTGLGRQTHLEGELPAVVVHPAGVHQAQHVPHVGGLEDLLSGGGAGPSVGQGGPHHGHGLRVDLQAAGLEVEVQGLSEVRVGREGVVLLHEVAHGKVPVGRLPLGEEDGVVEAEELVSRHPVESLEEEVVFLRQVVGWLDQLQCEGAGHDGSSIEHGIVRFA